MNPENKFTGAFELLFATCADANEHMQFWNAVQFIAERHGKQLCHRYEIERMQTDTLTMNHKVNDFLRSVQGGFSNTVTPTYQYRVGGTVY